MLNEKVINLKYIRNIAQEIAVPLTVWSSPERWSHFADIIKYQYPAQLTALNNLFVAYLIQEP